MHILVHRRLKDALFWPFCNSVQSGSLGVPPDMRVMFKHLAADVTGNRHDSLHEGGDTSVPNGSLVFGIFASIAECGRELIRDRVRCGLAAAKARGKHLGRPRVTVDELRIAELRSEGRDWKVVGAELGVGVGTVLHAAEQLNLRVQKTSRKSLP